MINFDIFHLQWLFRTHLYVNIIRNTPLFIVYIQIKNLTAYQADEFQVDKLGILSNKFELFHNTFDTQRNVIGPHVSNKNVPAILRINCSCLSHTFSNFYLNNLLHSRAGVCEKIYRLLQSVEQVCFGSLVKQHAFIMYFKAIVALFTIGFVNCEVFFEEKFENGNVQNDANEIIVINVSLVYFCIFCRKLERRMGLQ